MKSQEKMLELLARRLVAERDERGWSMSELAARTGVSVAQLSRIERGERSPSFGLLVSIADALGISPSRLLEEPTESGEDIRVPLGETTDMDGLGVATISRPHPSGVSVVEVTLTPGERSEFQSHAGTEWLYVLTGEVRVQLEEAGEAQPRPFVLAQGEAGQYSALLPHKLELADGQHEATVLLMTMP